MSRFFDSIRGRKKSSLQSPPLPILPSDRRPLTPLDDELLPLGDLSIFPVEILRQIVIFAFGNRTLHIDLRLARPRFLDGPPNDHVMECHSTAPCSGEYPIDMEAPKRWTWYGSVCHRGFSPAWEESMKRRGLSTYFCPHRDQCLQGRGLCEIWEGGSAIGALGWLGTSRRAYQVGIQVLYATNVFYVEAATMEVLTAGVVLQARLEMMARLEVRFDTGVLFGRDFEQHRPRLSACLEGLARMRSLKELVISIGDVYYDSSVKPRYVLKEIEGVLLRPIVDAVAGMKRLENLVVELPENIFEDLDKGPPGSRLQLGEAHRGKVWSCGKGPWWSYPGPEDLSLQIKRGEDSDLFWDYKGVPKSHAFITGHPSCGM
ncbi:hypothetical protein QBC42DRAFT_217960 [Cladorrhinum samala]|uniref:DUF7730 domain-containing protein n=1 Tax=Cladorrhinum samala TaxID=585594 RepID=A0AAV9HYE4_9PEZI|nr:hypothetical protein QBC42DRAFT_217960 [Cladorrhinum samala]